MPRADLMGIASRWLAASALALCLAAGVASAQVNNPPTLISLGVGPSNSPTFTGLTLTGNLVSGGAVSFTNATASTSTGALIVTGGVGIGGALNTGGAITTTVAAQTVSTFGSTGANKALLAITNAAGNLASGLSLRDAGLEKWEVIKNSNNGFTIFDSVNAVNVLNVTAAGVTTLGETSSTGNALTGDWTVGGAFTANSTVTFPAVTTGTNADFACFAAGGVLTLQTTACTISSMRFKDFIDWYYGFDAVGALQKLVPIVFTMKPGNALNADENYTYPQIGISAENVQAAEPLCSIYEPDGVTPKSYRQECLIALLVGGAQEQQNQIFWLWFVIALLASLNAAAAVLMRGRQANRG